MMSKFS